jgi:hypothetical protein
MTSGRAFVVLDRLLDQPTGGPLCLRRPEIAGVVVQALQDGQLRFQRYRAGLVALAEEFAWSSAAPGRSPAAG